MTDWVRLLLPSVLILARTAAFFATAPLVSSQAVPRQVKAGMAVMMTIFFAFLWPVRVAGVGEVKLLAAAVALSQEVLCGLALGLAARLVFVAIQQGGTLIGRQMGFAEASIMDPSSGESIQPLGMYFDVLFTLLFLSAGGHRLLLRLIGRSFEVLPVGGQANIGVLTAGVIEAGSTMLMLTLKLAAPLLAGFLILSVVLAILAPVLPQMNVLMTSLPLRVGVGLMLAIAIVPVLGTFTDEVARWMVRLL